MQGLTKSVDGTDGEFVIHVLGEYDYRFDSSDKDEVFDALKACYYYQTH